MPLSPGIRLGPYEILDAIGAGGMGEVYRARDSRLGRDVALKVLPEAFARDADRMLRFEREARVVASLNHPNIASLYGLEESNGARALVMELVEGPTLTERIKRGSLVSTQGGNRHIYQQAVNGTGAATSLVTGNTDEILPSWSSDERYLIFQTHGTQGNSQWEIWAQPLFGDYKAFPVAQKPQSLQGTPALSPDGKWLANDSDESGRIEVYVTPFLHGGGKWQVSTGGGSCPRWRADGHKLFYMSLENKIMSAEISAQTSSVVIGKVQQVFQANPVPFAPQCMYDVSADGKKMVVVTLAVEQGSQPLTLVVNWPPLLKKGRQQ